jgi:hypothetical protein
MSSDDIARATWKKSRQSSGSDNCVDGAKDGEFDR